MKDPASVSESMQSSSTDVELMAAVAVGDARAFAWLMQRHLKAMVSLAQRVLGNPHEADEVAQEGFLRLWTHAPQWDPDGTASIKTWLSRVVVNLCLDRLRRRRSVPLEEAGELVDPSDSAYDKARHDDRQRIVRLVLDQLPDRQRVAVALAYFEGLSGIEIARTMQVSVRAVESLLVRARRSLKEHLLTHGIVGNEDI